MARPRILRSVEWRTPEGERCTEKPPFTLAPTLTPQWIGDEIEPLSQYEERVNAFIEHREQPFARITEAERKRVERSSRTSEQIERERTREARRERAQRPPRIKPLKPFMGIDGEGRGIDRLGRQPYVLMTAADGQGYEKSYHLNGKAPSMKEWFEYILSLPASHIPVGFFFRYDANQILRRMIGHRPKTLQI